MSAVIAFVASSTKSEVELLVERLKDGDPSARVEVYNRFHSLGCKIARQYCRASEVEDVVHETFIQVYTQINTLRDNGAFVSWFKRLIAGTARNSAKRKVNHTYEGHDGGEPANRSIERTYECEPNAEMIHAELVAQLNKHLNQLSPKLRTVVDLFYYQNMSVKDISRQLDISTSATLVRLHDARVKLREWLDSRN